MDKTKPYFLMKLKIESALQCVILGLVLMSEAQVCSVKGNLWSGVEISGLLMQILHKIS